MLPESSGSEMLDKIMIIHELDPEFRKKIYRKKAQYDSKPDIWNFGKTWSDFCDTDFLSGT